MQIHQSLFSHALPFPRASPSSATIAVTTHQILFHPYLTGTALITDNAGNNVSSVKYLPYGETRVSTGTLDTNKLYTGQRLDDTGLYYYNARYYDPTIGRFISPDSIVPNVFNPQAFNRYSYCLNNPLMYIDPSGHQGISINIDINIGYLFPGAKVSVGLAVDVFGGSAVTWSGSYGGLVSGPTFSVEVEPQVNFEGTVEDLRTEGNYYKVVDDIDASMPVVLIPFVEAGGGYLVQDKGEEGDIIATQFHIGLDPNPAPSSNLMRERTGVKVGTQPEPERGFGLFGVHLNDASEGLAKVVNKTYDFETKTALPFIVDTAVPFCTDTVPDYLSKAGRGCINIVNRLNPLNWNW